MRRILGALVLVAAAAALAVAPAGAATVQVAIRSGGFAPSFTSVRAGDTVTWLNADTHDHQVVADDASFASPILRPGGTWSRTFAATGRARYHDGLNGKLKATVEVKAAPIPDGVTLALSQPYVHYGEEAHLSGTVSTRRAGEQVVVLAQPYPQGSYAELARVTTTTGGSWDYVVKPEILTSYEVRFRSATSGSVQAQVLPKITFLVSRGVFTTHVYGNHAFADRFVYVQQRSPLGQWVSLRKVLLTSESAASFRLTLKARVPHPLRIFMTVNQAGAGYLASTSGTQVVVRRCSSGAPAC